MKSIKEMAENEYPIRYNAGYRCTYDLNADGRKGYFKGANYVLEEIIACLPKTNCANPNEALDIIVAKIKELKK